MISIILANGEGSRFRQAGYTELPKFLLPGPDGEPVISQIAKRLPGDLHIITRRTWRRTLNDALERPFKAHHRNTSKGSPLADLLSMRIPKGREVVVSFCDCWCDEVDLFTERMRNRPEIDAGAVLFNSGDERHTDFAFGMKWGGLFWFRDWETVQWAATQLDDHSGCIRTLFPFLAFEVFTSYTYIDVGVPEDYEKWKNSPLFS